MTDIEILLDRTRRHAVDFLNSLEHRPVHPTATLKELRCRLGAPLEDRGRDAAQVIDDLVIATSGGHLGSASGRSFAWVMGGALPSALAADWLVSTWDNNAAMYLSAPAAAVVEEVAGQWVKDILGLPARASFAFTTGCQMAHATCLAAARHALLNERGWNVERDGLFDAPRIRVLANENRHGSLTRALRLLGFGSNCVEPLATDADSRVEPATLKAAIQQKSDAPTIVVLNAADLNVGAFDPFGELIPLAKASGAWVHVDGAFGLWARASTRRRSLADGVEGADSWATDAHKWLNVPHDSGLAIVRDVEALQSAMSISASYYPPDPHAKRQPMQLGPESSRRARAVEIWAALRSLGKRGVEELIERTCGLAEQFASGLRAAGYEVLNDVVLNQVLVSFGDNEKTDRIINAIQADGTCWCGGTVWKGRKAMRISVSSWVTTDSDVARSLAAMLQIATADTQSNALQGELSAS